MQMSVEEDAIVESISAGMQADTETVVRELDILQNTWLFSPCPSCLNTFDRCLCPDRTELYKAACDRLRQGGKCK